MSKRFRALKDGTWYTLDLNDGGQKWSRELLELMADDEKVFEFETPQLQFTGLKDKNDQEIYIDDVLRCQNHIADIEFDRVEFQRGVFGVVSKKPGGGFVPLRDICRRSEVIGNIHQNPELLEAKCQ